MCHTTTCILAMLYLSQPHWKPIFSGAVNQLWLCITWPFWVHSKYLLCTVANFFGTEKVCFNQLTLTSNVWTQWVCNIYICNDSVGHLIFFSCSQVINLCTCASRAKYQMVDTRHFFFEWNIHVGVVWACLNNLNCLFHHTYLHVWSHIHWSS